MTAAITGVMRQAATVRTGERRAAALTAEALDRIAAQDGALNAVTHVFPERADSTANRVDDAVRSGHSPGVLAGQPFAAKNLFDVAGHAMPAGSALVAERAPARRDATAIARLEAAGAILVAATNMDPYAYGYTCENTAFGNTANPVDTARSPGGSSGGSAAAVAAGWVPFALGTDTNGSLRVPAALCGITSFKPTFGRLSRAGVYAFVPSLDHVGPLALSVQDLAAVTDALGGDDPRDPDQGDGPWDELTPRLEDGPEDLKIAIAGGYFREGAEATALAAVDAAADALGIEAHVTLPDAGRARAAAFIITAAQAGNLQLPALRQRASAFDPIVRDRLLSGAVMPASWLLQAQRFRRWFAKRMAELFEGIDIILAPATPFAAPRIGQQTTTLAGEEMPVRLGLGRFVQPLTLAGLPIATVPYWGGGGLPYGVQVIGAPGRDGDVLRTARALERAGFAARTSPVQASVAPPSSREGPHG